jgi:hypothetical protein
MRPFDKKYNALITLFIITLISRLPFLSAGYGVEEDSWGIALAAFHTKLTGIYEPSRLPGHPIQELLYSALWGNGPIVFNGLCALFSSIGIVYFALILKQLRFKHYLFAAFAFAFIPVYYISSTYTIDFVWTETFVLISFYYLLRNKFITCGIFLGLAIGCRITSGAMLFPFMLIAWQNNNLKQNIITLIKIGIPMAFIAILAFIPVISQFGLSFFMYYDQFPYPPLPKVMYKMIIGVFGFIGTIALAVAAFLIIFRYQKQKPGEAFEEGLSKKIIAASFTILILYSISYFRLPQKSGYMIPVLPFVILLFAYYLNSNNFKWLCTAFILSSFVCSINLTDRLRGASYSEYSFLFKVAGQEIFFDPFSGPVFSDYSKRKQKMEYTKNVITKTDTIQHKTVIIAGWWCNEIMVETIQKNRNNFVIFESYIDSVKINNYVRDGYKIKYLPEQNVYNDLMYKMNITNTVSQEFK